MKIGDKITIELEAVKSIYSSRCLYCYLYGKCTSENHACKDEDLIFVVVEKPKEDEL